MRLFLLQGVGESLGATAPALIDFLVELLIGRLQLGGPVSNAPFQFGVELEELRVRLLKLMLGFLQSAVGEAEGEAGTE